MIIEKAASLDTTRQGHSEDEKKGCVGKRRDSSQTADYRREVRGGPEGKGRVSRIQATQFARRC